MLHWSANASHNLSYFASTCSESVRFTLALYSMSVVLTKLFSPEAPRPMAANADQGARVKKKMIGNKVNSGKMPMS